MEPHGHANTAWLLLAFDLAPHVTVEDVIGVYVEYTPGAVADTASEHSLYCGEGSLCIRIEYETPSGRRRRALWGFEAEAALQALFSRGSR